MGEQITTAEELDALPEAFVVEFEYRSDDGMRIVGTFPTHEAAQEWLHAAPIRDYEAAVVPIQVDRDLLAEARAEGARQALLIAAEAAEASAAVWQGVARNASLPERRRAIADAKWEVMTQEAKALRARAEQTGGA